jgi:hypothetical protein
MRRALLALALAGALAPASAAMRRTGEQLFVGWVEGQATYADVRFADLAKRLDADYARTLVSRLPPEVRPQVGFLRLPKTERLDDGAIEAVLGAARELLPLLDGRVPELLERLAAQGFATEAVDAAERDHEVETRRKYRRFLAALLNRPQERERRQALFALANRFFEYCFSPETHAAFRALLKRPASGPIVRLLHEAISYRLARTGWHAWHETTLETLGRRHAEGHEIVYIAGGTDILRLLERGIYNVRVIDPMFPSQAEYYLPDWELFVKGAIGDEIAIQGKEGRPGIVLRRAAHRRRGSFATGTLSDGSRRRLPRTRTTWTIRSEDGKALGRLVFDRRFLRQSDLRRRPKKTLVISVNELPFVVTSGPESWGMRPDRFDDRFELFVKQLRMAVTLPVVRNLNASASQLRWGSAVR